MRALISVVVLLAVSATEPPWRQAPPAPAVEPPVFKLLGIDQAWRVTRGANVTVGVVDVGFDYRHPALRPVLTPAFFAADVFHSGAGSIVAHGTAVSSVIAGQPDADGRPIGFAPEARLLAAARGMPEHRLLKLQKEAAVELADGPEALRVFMAEHGAELRAFSTAWRQYVTRTTADAIEFLVTRGVDVINISEYLSTSLLAGDPAGLARVEAAFDLARSRDVVVVIGAGNNDSRVDGYPGSDAFVLVVGASTLDDRRWRMSVTVNGRTVAQGSNYGSRLSVVAPMEQLIVARPHDPAMYRLLDSPVGPIDERFTGIYETVPHGATSLSTAVVTALVALVRSARPDLPAEGVIAAVRRGARDLGDPGRDDQTGAGRVDFGRTLHLVRDGLPWSQK